MNGNFSKIKNELINSEIKDSEFKIMCYLIGSSKDGKCYPSIRTMAAKLNKSKATVMSGINELVNKGFITRNKRVTGKGKITSNEYVISEQYLSIKKTIEEPEREVQNIELYDYNWLEDDNG